jgi:hypothetical protein
MDLTYQTGTIDLELSIHPTWIILTVIHSYQLALEDRKFRY